VKTRAVFLDRDGVLNKALVRDGKPYPPANLAEFEIVAGAKEGLQALRAAGFLLIVVTNQPDIARGTQTRQMLEELHTALRSALPLDAIYVCDHDSPEQCACRKPRPGMLLTASQDLNIDLPSSFLIGDRWRDVDAGASAGCQTVFLDFKYSERGPDHSPSKTVSSLQEGIAWILSQATAAA
jgi:D-glycero-D-manno-heptose 1,7-bisphosphate phosphatase